MWTDVSILSGGTVSSVTPDKIIPRKKRNMKSPAISPLIKDPITNQDITIVFTKKNWKLPPQLAKFTPNKNDY